MTLNRFAILSLIVLTCTIGILFCTDQIIKLLSESLGKEPIGLLDFGAKYVAGIAITVAVMFIAVALCKNR